MSEEYDPVKASFLKGGSILGLWFGMLLTITTLGCAILLDLPVFYLLTAGSAWMTYVSYDYYHDITVEESFDNFDFNPKFKN